MHIAVISLVNQPHIIVVGSKLIQEAPPLDLNCPLLRPSHVDEEIMRSQNRSFELLFNVATKVQSNYTSDKEAAFQKCTYISGSFEFTASAPTE